MDKKLPYVDHLFYHSLCSYYYQLIGEPDDYLENRLITYMLSRIMTERAKDSFIGTRRYHAIARRIKKMGSLTERDSVRINMTFKVMARIMKRKTFDEVMLINSLGVMNGVYIPIHLVTRQRKRGNPYFHHVHYYYSDVPPTEHQIHNDIRIASAVVYVERKYQRTSSEILWRDQRFKVTKKKINKQKVLSELSCLTASLCNDIIYKSIGKWCEKCTVRGTCG